MRTSDVICPDDITKRPIACPFPDCSGCIEHLTIATALALAEHFGTRGGHREVQGQCKRCQRQSRFSYDQLLTLLPVERRPRQLPAGLVLAIALARLPRPPDCDGDFYLGERLLVEFRERNTDEWIGILQARSGLAPSLPLGSILGGGFMSEFAVIYGHLISNEAHPLPFEEPQPSTLDTGLFYVPDASADTLLSANLFCTNPSCPHIFAPYYSQVIAMIRQEVSMGAFLSADGILCLSCERCGMSRVVAPGAYEGLYKL